jgi:hypothetical protein
LPDFGALQYSSTKVGTVPTVLTVTIPEVVVKVTRV